MPANCGWAHELVERLPNHRRMKPGSGSEFTQYSGAGPLLLTDIDPTLQMTAHIAHIEELNRHAVQSGVRAMLAKVLADTSAPRRLAGARRRHRT